MGALLSLLSPVDYAALLWFCVASFGYAFFAFRKAQHAPSLLGAMNLYRRKWMERIVERENRIVDSSLINMLSSVATFLASTTVLILGGLVALLGTTEKAVDVMAELPFAVQGSHRLWEIKVLLLIGIFGFAFFKFTWALRQFNMLAILVGAAPSSGADARDAEDFIRRSTDISVYAGENFNNGLRSYYFGLAALAWFLHPVLFALATAGVVLVLYQREFRSLTLETLVGIHGKGDWEWPPRRILPPEDGP
ncbi:MAG TPA: DUF599 domain-containing protein [Burkholderiales bacterium]|nr:DUF599 domain-containing protein [Burkholderiales bacterium]